MSTESFRDEAVQAGPGTNKGVLHPLIADLDRILSEEQSAYQLLCPARSGWMMGPTLGVVIDMVDNYVRGWPECWAGSTKRRVESKRDKTVRSVVVRISKELANANIEFALIWMLPCDDRASLHTHGLDSQTALAAICREQKMRLSMR